MIRTPNSSQAHRPGRNLRPADSGRYPYPRQAVRLLRLLQPPPRTSTGRRRTSPQLTGGALPVRPPGRTGQRQENQAGRGLHTSSAGPCGPAQVRSHLHPRLAFRLLSNHAPPDSQGAHHSRGKYRGRSRADGSRDPSYHRGVTAPRTNGPSAAHRGRRAALRTENLLVGLTRGTNRLEPSENRAVTSAVRTARRLSSGRLDQNSPWGSRAGQRIQQCVPSFGGGSFHDPDVESSGDSVLEDAVLVPLSAQTFATLRCETADSQNRRLVPRPVRAA